MQLIDIKSLTLNQLSQLFDEYEIPKFRANQVFAWLSKGVCTFDEMTNLPLVFREKLSEIAYISKINLEKKLVSKKDGTVKYLFAFFDDNTVESVVMRYKYGNTICISTQVGCAMGCVFCASTKNGLVRNLSAAEMYDQVIFAQKDIGERIDNIVLMGMGEPLNNFDNVINFMYNVNCDLGLNIGLRHISLSTCGIIPGIQRLAQLALPINLSISLHSAFSDKRSELMPINQTYPIAELMTACIEYQNITKRKLYFEYSLINGFNDTDEDARGLVRLLSGCKRNCHVNLIRVNKISEIGYSPPSVAATTSFCDFLNNNGISATVRRKLGDDIFAACGQLKIKASLEK